jgi:hypothetical protein
MEFMLKLPLQPSIDKISHKDEILLIGSCFTEEIGQRLKELKFKIFQNPTGIIYSPLAIASTLERLATVTRYTTSDLEFHDDLWHSWDHHSSFSATSEDVVLKSMNDSFDAGVNFLRDSKWLILTLGSAFVYHHKQSGKYVANCHKYPASAFDKHLLEIDDMAAAMQKALDSIQHANKKIRIILTVSPVRHIKDGVVANTRSKARLHEVIHQLEQSNNNVFYFPAYELVIDVLRDYRFYSTDLVHPNDTAVQYVFEQFSSTYFGAETLTLNKEIEKLKKATHHRPFREDSSAHKDFLQHQYIMTQDLQRKNPELDLSDELKYFRSRINQKM